MTVQPSQTRIVNKALVMLGTSQRILSLDDNSSLATAAAAVFAEALDETLADHPWNFAIARAQLAADTAAPPFEWQFAYPLPADCLRWLPWSEADDSWFEGEEEQGRVLANREGPLNIRYIRRIEDPAIWSAGFKHALACRLAAMLAFAVTQKASVAEKMDARYADAIAAARKQDGLATGRRNRRQRYNSRFLQARQDGVADWYDHSPEFLRD